MLIPVWGKSSESRTGENPTSGSMREASGHQHGKAIEAPTGESLGKRIGRTYTGEKLDSTLLALT